jgi:hypothetical protein
MYFVRGEKGLHCKEILLFSGVNNLLYPISGGMRTHTSISTSKKFFSHSIQDIICVKYPDETVKRIVQKEFFLSQRRKDEKTRRHSFLLALNSRIGF